MTILQLPTQHLVPASRAKAMVFEDLRSKQLLRHIELIAPSAATVLITGETGTGKEIVARHVHSLSLRAHGAFHAVNCAAFSDTLVESELFGHERGAFTGADRAKAGWFETASAGTLFLDEVGDLPMSMQVKLLRVLQESEVVRIGGRTPIPVDVRLIAATNVDLEQAIERGQFRADLFYRLQVSVLRLLPLRERRGDILPLASYFAAVHASRLGLPAPEMAREAEAKLLEYPWPGNIRELDNSVHNAVLMARGGTLEASHFELAASRSKPITLVRAPLHAAAKPVPEVQLEAAFRAMFEREGAHLYDRIEELLFRTAYEHCDENQLETARLLGISRNIVRARLADHGHLPARRDRSSRPGATRVRVGYQRFGLLLLVKALRRLERELALRGIEIEWREYHAGPELLAALEGGVLDMGVVGELPPISAQAARIPFVYVAAEAPAPDAEAIIVHEESSVRSVVDLRGKRVALSAGSNVHYLLLRALEEAKLDRDDIELSFGSLAECHEAFYTHKVDAWALWDPLLAAVQRTARTRVLRDASGLTSNAAYYVARREFADAEPEIVETVVAYVARAGDEARESPDALARELSDELDLPCEGLALALRRLRGASPLTEELLASQQHIADDVLRMRMIPHPISVKSAQWRPPTRALRRQRGGSAPGTTDGARPAHAE